MVNPTLDPGGRSTFGVRGLGPKNGGPGPGMRDGGREGPSPDRLHATDVARLGRLRRYSVTGASASMTAARTPA